MKIALVAVAGLAVGLGGGAAVSALRVKGELLEAHAQAAADSAAAADHGVAAAHGDEGGVSVVLPVDEDSTTAVSPDSAGEAHHEELEEAVEGDVPDTASGNGAPVTDPDAVADSASGDGADSPAALGPGADVDVMVLNPEGAKKLAKIFGAMKPADAAAVLTEMTDEEVKVVLLQMNDRQAAPILGNFPPERAAALSQVVLRDRGSA